VRVESMLSASMVENRTNIGAPAGGWLVRAEVRPWVRGWGHRTRLRARGDILKSLNRKDMKDMKDCNRRSR